MKAAPPAAAAVNHVTVDSHAVPDTTAPFSVADNDSLDSRSLGDGQAADEQVPACLQRSNDVTTQIDQSHAGTAETRSTHNAAEVNCDSSVQSQPGADDVAGSLDEPDCGDTERVTSQSNGSASLTARRLQQSATQQGSVDFLLFCWFL